jgi:hypothetical protein
VPLKFARELPPAVLTVTTTEGPPGVIEYVAAPAGTTEAARTAAAATAMDTRRAARGERARRVGAYGVIATSNCEDGVERPARWEIVKGGEGLTTLLSDAPHAPPAEGSLA